MNEPMYSRLPWTTLALVGFIATLPGGAAAGDWPYAKHDMGGTARSAGQGAISALSGQLPTLVQTIQLDELDLGDRALFDVDTDGTADLVVPLRGKVTAYSGVDGSLLWSTPVLGATEIVGLADLDGDGFDEELVVAAPDMGGGIYAVNSVTGGLQWSHGPLTNRSGVGAVEVEIVDLDGDGADELVFGEWSFGSEYVYVVDFPTGFSSEEVFQLSLPGAYINLNPLISGPLVDNGVGFMAHQGQNLAWFEVCAAGDAGATCTPSESLCVCEPAMFEMVHPTYSAGPFLARDVDGDGVDEVIDVLTDSRFGYEMGVYDVGQGMASGSPVTDDLILWKRSYGLPDPSTHVVFPEGEPADLDGDGDLDLVATFYDNTTAETDHWGQPAEDGIDHPSALAVGVFDALSGELVAWEADAFAWGLVDLDDDGVDEIVLSATTGWTYEAGLRGAEIVCDPDCSFDTQWMSAGHSLVRNLTQFDDAGFPEATLSTLDTDGSGEHQLLAFDGAHLDLLDLDGGNVDVVATALLDDEEEVMAVAADGSAVLLATETEARLLDAELADIVAPMDLPGQKVSQVAAVQLDPADDKAALIVDGAVFWSTPSPTDLADADVLLLDHFAFGADLTGDGYAELVSWSQPDDTEDGRLAVEMMSYDPTDPDGDGTPFGQLWHFSAADVPELAGYEVIGTEGLAVRPADLDGGGVSEIVLACVSPATYEFMLVALDGVTGSVDLLLPVDFMLSNGLSKLVPIWVEDLDDAQGSGSPDGFDDLVLADFLGLHLVAGGMAPISSVETGVYHRSGLVGDLTGDGALEMVIVRNSQTDLPMTARAMEAGFADVWGGEQAITGLPTYGIENLALIDADDAAGLDLVFGGGSGTLELYSGQDGALVDGFPVMLSDGAMVGHDDGAAMLAAVAVVDVDGDGFEEVVVGGMDGYLYAVNVDAGEAGAPTLEWSIFIGVPVERIAVADTDGDGLDEVVVVGPESAVHVIDGLGAFLSIEEPSNGACLATMPFEVSGTAEGIETVDVWISGVLAASDVPVSGGAWGETGFAVAGLGTWQILATGKNADGAIVAQAQVLVVFDGDDDGDGITICGGDCDDDDAETYPGAEELCDGLDNDCDTVVPEDEIDMDADGFSGCEGDCDDGDAEIFPGAEDICENGIDEDCDGGDAICYSPGDDDDDITPEADGCDCRLADQRGNPAPLALILAAGVWMVSRRRQRRDP